MEAILCHKYMGKLSLGVPSWWDAEPVPYVERGWGKLTVPPGAFLWTKLHPTLPTKAPGKPNLWAVMGFLATSICGLEGRSLGQDRNIEPC